MKAKENSAVTLPILTGITPVVNLSLDKPSPQRQKSHSNASYRSETETAPKMKNIKSQILKIPKARQLLNMDRHVYMQDVEKRIELLGDLKEDDYKAEIVHELHTLCKPVKKKTKRHKTNFKVPLTKNNLERMNKIVQSHIDLNRKFMNEQVVVLKDYEKTLKFLDQLDETKKLYKEKFKYQKGNLSKNKLMLEHVILSRNVKRELTLKKREERKEHALNVMAKIEEKRS